MIAEKTTFAVLFGNRGFFPASHQASARLEIPGTLEKLGHKVLMLPEDATRYGAVETPREGEMFAGFLRNNRGRFGGVILSLPNFGDETGAIAALKDCGVPVLIHAYPDDLDKMAPSMRRDSFCGKFSVMDVFTQYGLPFTALKPHTVHPSSKAFSRNIDYFDRVCRVYNGMKDMILGAIGARTSAFKTVRIDELTLQRHGITTETVDLSSIIARVQRMKPNDARVKKKMNALSDYSNWDSVPRASMENMAKLGVVLDEVIEELNLDALSIRCWIELPELLQITPCVLASMLNECGMPMACELDLGSAATMYGFQLASGRPSACLDLNNNYGQEDNKCILFHCGESPKSMMTDNGRISDHAILANALEEGGAYGAMVGRIAPAPFTYGNALTLNGKICFYLGEGRFTDDPIPDDFFGCAGVAEIPNLQDVLQTIGYLGHKHHTTVTTAHVAAPVREAFEKYLGYEVTML